MFGKPLIQFVKIVWSSSDFSSSSSRIALWAGNFFFDLRLSFVTGSWLFYDDVSVDCWTFCYRSPFIDGISASDSSDESFFMSAISMLEMLEF